MESGTGAMDSGGGGGLPPNRPWLAAYPPGVPAAVTVPAGSVPEHFLTMSERFAQRAAIIFYGQRITYRELRAQVERLAAALAGLGVGRGDVVALYLLGSPQYIIAYLATLLAGATVTPVSPVFTSHELRHQLADSGARTVICQDILYDNLERTGLPVDHIIVTAVDEYLPPLRRMLGRTLLRHLSRKAEVPAPRLPVLPNLHRFQDLVRRAAGPVPRPAIDPAADVATITYSGGTTGPPKGVMLTHRQLLATQAQLRAFLPMLQEGQEVYPAYLPLYHAYGQLIVLIGGLTLGATLVVFTTPDLDEILDAVDGYGFTVFWGVPTLYERLNEHPRTDRVNWRRLKLFICGADTLFDRTVAEWERRTGTVITEGYGQTECGALAMLARPGVTPRGSIGVPVPGLEAAIMDLDADTFLPPGEVGEIVVSGPNVMKGYWDRPEATGEVLVEAGGQTWLRTGDIGRRDPDGHFYFVERKRDLIKYKGYSVFARDVEEVLHVHPQVRAAGVVGVPDPRVGQIVKAHVVLQAEARGKVSEEEIIRWCQERLAHYKVPRIVEFRGELPKTDVGKVSRRELREEPEEVRE